MTRGQGGPGWMAARPFRFSSTSFHTLVNVRSAQYFNTSQLLELHAEAKSIVQLNPSTDITHDNVTELEDETLPSQRSGLHAVISPNTQRTKHSNITPKYWLNLCSNRQKLIEKCIEHGIGEFTRPVVINQKQITNSRHCSALTCNRQLPAPHCTQARLCRPSSAYLPAACRYPRGEREREQCRRRR